MTVEESLQTIADALSNALSNKKYYNAKDDNNLSGNLQEIANSLEEINKNLCELRKSVDRVQYSISCHR